MATIKQSDISVTLGHAMYMYNVIMLQYKSIHALEIHTFHRYPTTSACLKDTIVQ